MLMSAELQQQTNVTRTPCVLTLKDLTSVAAQKDTRVMERSVQVCNFGCGFACRITLTPRHWHFDLVICTRGRRSSPMLSARDSGSYGPSTSPGTALCS